MRTKNKIPWLLLASVIVTTFVYILNSFGVDLIVWHKRAFEYNYHINLLVMYSISWLVFALAAIPALLLLIWRKFPRAISLTLFAVTVAYSLSFLTLLAAKVTGLGAWAWPISKLAAITIAFFAGNILFNKWQARFRYKVAAAIGIIVLTAIISDRILVFIS